MEGRQSDLQDKWALVTGASSGFGADFAHLLAARGANLVLVARRSEPMKALSAELKRRHGKHCHVIAMDLARPGVGAELYAKVKARRVASISWSTTLASVSSVILSISRWRAK